MKGEEDEEEEEEIEKSRRIWSPVLASHFDSVHDPTLLLLLGTIRFLRRGERKVLWEEEAEDDGDDGHDDGHDDGGAEEMIMELVMVIMMVMIT
eukprot:754745-Hanusia_phi.AAC.1